MATILVTGGAGFIGSNIAVKLKNQGNNVIIMDNFSTGYHNLQYLKSNDIHIINHDINHIDALQYDFHNLDSIIHLAAMNRAPRSIKNPKLSHEVNITSTLNILEIARKFDLDLIIASSSSVFGNLITQPRPEVTYEYKPLHPYGLGKLACEYYSDIYRDLYGLNSTIIRYFSVYGPRQSPSLQYSAVIPKFINSFINKQPITIYGGSQSRNFTYVDDTADATICLLDKTNLKTKYNIGGNEEITINELVNVLEIIFDFEIEKIYAPMIGSDLMKSIPSMSNIKTQFSFKHKYNFSEGLRKTVQWFKNNPNYFKNNMSN